VRKLQWIRREGNKGMIYPLRTLYGIPVMVDTKMSNDRLRFVDPVTAQRTDFILPAAPRDKDRGDQA
jgi:hypothetical protein